MKYKFSRFLASIPLVLSPLAYSYDLGEVLATWEDILRSDLESYEKNIKKDFVLIGVGDIVVPIEVEASTDSMIQSLCALVDSSNSCEETLNTLAGINALEKPYATAFDLCWEESIDLVIEGTLEIAPYMMDYELEQAKLALEVENKLESIETSYAYTDSEGNSQQYTMEEIFWRNEILIAKYIGFSGNHDDYIPKTCEYIYSTLAAPGNELYIKTPEFNGFETGLDPYGICPIKNSVVDHAQIAFWGDFQTPRAVDFYDESHRFGFYLNNLWRAYQILSNDENTCGYEEEDLDEARRQLNEASDVEKISTLLHYLQIFHDSLTREEVIMILKYQAAKEFHPDWDRIQTKLDNFRARWNGDSGVEIPMPFL